ncbi:MSMEG_0565 family glycosyltransferase [Leptolyngbya sp. FACHB-671]|uniref:MSMEG_0565 family glycosyltransferase n=1 Tax=Leptolyngbya sp. FACHB-671 TaxID=2692812 RepID=UPI0016820AFD|nr:MSMEG_0565 family glycosyltransferase [Leptolyngbya sp. FACHB-671]MBD2066819.1 MSMEG_0565 family glycosyltransferase [Leptolyngbya sp. FACHB-671]
MVNSLRIAFFTYSTKPRGSVVHTLEVAEALQELGHSVCVYALDKDGTGFYRSLQCDHVLVPAKEVTGGIDQLIKQRIQEFVDYLSQEKPVYDYYHAQDCLSANALSELRSRHHIPHFVRTVHHIDAFNSPYLQTCQDRSIREPDLCLCVSDRWQTALQEQYQIHAPKVINGVKTTYFSPDYDGSEADVKNLGLSGQPIYLTVGGIEPRKNSITLLRAFAQVLTHYPNAQLVIAGGATLFDYQPYRDEFFQLAERLGVAIAKSLILPGVISTADLPALYRIADAFVFPSLKEGWGLVVLEAMASGIPVITSNIAPFTEFLSEREALLVDPESEGAIAQAMQTTVQPQIAQSFKEQGIQVAKRYTWKQSAKLHLTHYQQFSTSPVSNPQSHHARNSLSN